MAEVTWVRLDDHFADHPKVLAAGATAAWLYVCGLCYSARHLTDGFLAEAQVRRLAEVRNPIGLADQLVTVALWEKVEGGYLIHDYLHYNPSRAKVLQDRAKTAQRVNDHREKQRGNADVTPLQTALKRPSNAPPVPQPRPDPFPEEESSEVLHTSPSDRTAQSDARRGRNEYPVDFEHFWATYPGRRLDKYAALGEWQRRLKGGVAAADLVRAAGHFASYCEQNGTEDQFIPHARTWLHQRRFEAFARGVPEANGRVPTSIRNVLAAGSRFVEGA